MEGKFWEWVWIFRDVRRTRRLEDGILRYICVYEGRGVYKGNWYLVFWVVKKLRENGIKRELGRRDGLIALNCTKGILESSY